MANEVKKNGYLTTIKMSDLPQLYPDQNRGKTQRKDLTKTYVNLPLYDAEMLVRAKIRETRETVNLCQLKRKIKNGIRKLSTADQKHLFTH